MTYWQIAAGANGRDYSHDFLRYGMAFVGGHGNEKAMSEVREGDMILLKQGLSRILAVGQVVKRAGHSVGHAAKEPDKDWLFHYDGWELPAYCHVDWRKSAPPKQLEGRPLSRSAIDRVQQTEIQRLVKEMFKEGAVHASAPEPGCSKPLTDGEILDWLLQHRRSAAVDLAQCLPKLRELADFYDNHGSDVREHETRTFLIIPFLRALGWTEKQIKIEMPVLNDAGRVDVACFDQPYAGPQSRQDQVRILESKGFSRGLTGAGWQAVGYASHFPRCELAVATNGPCYMAFRSSGDGANRKFAPVAYLNLRRPTHRYPLSPGEIDGGLKLIELLLAPSRLS